MTYQTDTTDAPTLPRSQEIYTRFGSLEKRLGSFKELGDNWYDTGSKAIAPKVIKRAQKLLREILFAISDDSVHRIRYIEVFPLIDGGVQFELGTAEREMEIELPSDSELLTLVKEYCSTGEMIEDSVPESQIRTLMEWLLA